MITCLLESLISGLVAFCLVSVEGHLDLRHLGLVGGENALSLLDGGRPTTHILRFSSGSHASTVSSR
uniref:Secreted protein n=1 Tax=Leersia perrieri TaxID=77586 RepID=A0A0D9XBJ3_9ORYZ